MVTIELPYSCLYTDLWLSHTEVTTAEQSINLGHHIVLNDISIQTQGQRHQAGDKDCVTFKGHKCIWFCDPEVNGSI